MACPPYFHRWTAPLKGPAAAATQATSLGGPWLIVSNDPETVTPFVLNSTPATLYRGRFQMPPGIGMVTQRVRMFFWHINDLGVSVWFALRVRAPGGGAGQGRAQDLAGRALHRPV